MKNLRIIGLLFGCLMLVATATTAMADSFVLEGNYLRVGVSESGGLIDDDFNAGIMFDPSGTKNFGIADYITPGSPFEFYSIGINGEWDTTGYEYGNTFGVTTINTSSGTTFSANSTGAFGALSITQNLWFDENSSVIHFLVTGTNTGESTLNNVVYARGLDPDQDYDPYGEYNTFNSIPASNRVRAVGPYSNWFIDIEDQSGGGVPTVDEEWDTDPYNLLVPHNDGDGDNTINMAWNAGDIEPGASVSAEFTYSVGVVPEPISLILFVSGGAIMAGRRYLKRRK